jgi:hypothetical protein
MARRAIRAHDPVGVFDAQLALAERSYQGTRGHFVDRQAMARQRDALALRSRTQQQIR